MYVCMYVYRERERDGWIDRYRYMYVCNICTHTHTHMQ
jgi:hypothetical protein